MDLGAYAQIEELKSIAEANGIVVPRLRGYRLMKDEEPDTWDYGDKEVECVESLCTSVPFWNPNADCHEWSLHTDMLKNYYLKSIYDSQGNKTYSVCWDRIHGRKRKILKTFIHNEKKRVEKQRAAWNKYAGRKDVLYIHARIGGSNWSQYHSQVDTKPWFLEKADDSYDDTYCDIYAKIEKGVEE